MNSSSDPEIKNPPSQNPLQSTQPSHPSLNSMHSEASQEPIISSQNNISNSSPINNNNINEINNNNNIDNNIINHEININVINNKKETIVPFSFSLFFILNTLCLIQTYLPNFEITDYSLCLWPIVNKHQYYRIISNHFYHVGVFHYLINMIVMYFVIKQLENEIGTLFTIIISIHSMVIVSLIYLLMMFLLKKLLQLSIYNFSAQCGFSCVCFTFYLFYFLLKKNNDKVINLFFFGIKGIHSSFLILFLFQMLTPNSSVIGHMGGLLCALCIYKGFVFITFPKYEWVYEAEKLINSNYMMYANKYVGYISVTENENVTSNAKEISKFFDFQKCVDNNNNNNNNDNNNRNISENNNNPNNNSGGNNQNNNSNNNANNANFSEVEHSNAENVSNMINEGIGNAVHPIRENELNPE